VDDGLGGESVTSGDCLVCHNNSKHQTLADPQVRLFNRDTSSTILYDGTNTSLEPFCVSCHDGDADTPFSDGNTPPDVNETAWALSSHKAGGMSCVGDGTSNGCHANGHGSDNTSMRAPFDSPAPDEEGFCYSCHATVMAEYSTILTGTSDNGGLLNAHHDISDADQAYSGAVLECLDCHNPHTASPGQKVIHDVDPGDGRDPAAGNTFPASTYITEFCFECHDNSFPAGVTAPTNPLADLFDAWVDTGGSDQADQHGAGAGSAVLRPGSGYQQGDILQCTDCHDAGHGSSNLYQLKTTVYSKDGTTPLQSDAGGTVVQVTDTAPNNTNVLTNGKNWCSTCHPGSMGNKDCFGCHVHGSNRF
jgi:hypothetical protein